MSVVGNLLAAQERRDSARVTEAIAEQLQDLTSDNATDTVTAAAAAYRQATTRRVQRPAPARHSGIVGFGDPAPDPLAGFEDEERRGEPDPRSDPRYLIQAGPPPAVVEPAAAPIPWWFWAVLAAVVAIVLVLIGTALGLALRIVLDWIGDGDVVAMSLYACARKKVGTRERNSIPAGRH